MVSSNFEVNDKTYLQEYLSLRDHAELWYFITKQRKKVRVYRGACI